MGRPSQQTFQTMTQILTCCMLQTMNWTAPLCPACDTFISRFNIAAYFTYTCLLLLQWQAELGSSMYAQTWWHSLYNWRSIRRIYIYGNKKPYAGVLDHLVVKLKIRKQILFLKASVCNEEEEQNCFSGTNRGISPVDHTKKLLSLKLLSYCNFN